ncbi:hypothetical protein ACLESD_54090, partial [Pyxidicoccus sp. 3LFB2]
ELWKSDGTEAGTVRVKDIVPGPSSSSPQGLVVMNGALYFNAWDATTGSELWRSDGTEAGTVRVKDIYPKKLHRCARFSRCPEDIERTLRLHGVYGARD